MKNIKNLLQKGVNSFIIGSGWVKNNDIELYDFIVEQLEVFVHDEFNTTITKDVIDFKKGKWLVEYTFTEDSVSYIAGEDTQSIANQPIWGTDDLEDCDESTLRLLVDKLEQSQYRERI